MGRTITAEKILKHFHFCEEGNDWDAVVIYDEDGRPTEISWHGTNLSTTRFEEVLNRDIFWGGSYHLVNMTVRNGVFQAKIERTGE